MDKDKIIPGMKSYEDIAEFWNTHSLADYWDQTEPAEFEISSDVRRHYFVTVDPDIFRRAQIIAKSRGLSTESLVNLLLEQRLHELEAAS